jgi:hypothetical protein
MPHIHARPLIRCLTVASTQARANLDELAGGLGLLPYLEAEPSVHMNWPGHPTTICKIRAGIWQTEPLTATKDGLLVFPDPERHFDIHFELQVQQFNNGRLAWLSSCILKRIRITPRTS